jgi:hypothetical protein
MSLAGFEERRYQIGEVNYFVSQRGTGVCLCCCCMAFRRPMLVGIGLRPSWRVRTG